MRTRLTFAGCVLAGLIGGSCRTPVPSTAATVKDDDPGRGGGAAADNRSPQGGLRGSSDASPTFQIKGDYPDQPGFLTAEPPLPDMATIQAGQGDASAVAAAKDWMTKIQAYIYDDMNDKNFALSPRPADPSAFRPSNARWYHMPWLHTPNATASAPGRGREGTMGLTRELDFKGPVIKWPKVAGTTGVGQDWGVGFYNEAGAYAIGQVFPAGNAVNLGFRAANGQLFPAKTVAFKILFSTAAAIASPAGDDLADGAYQVTASINGGGGLADANGARSPAAVRHIQMDVTMRFGDGPDDWIFGNWVYDKTANSDPTLWHGMRPMGVQWGPQLAKSITFSPDFEANGFRKAGEPTSRLNGPADNPLSSCLSCHARSQWPEPPFARLPFAPRNNADAKLVCLLHDWGGESACGIACTGDCIPAGTAPIVGGGQTLDYSLQLALALRNRQITLGGGNGP